jgi:hypothetical protein
LPFKVKNIYVDNERRDLDTIAFDGKSLVIEKEFSEIHIIGE